jgi:hypothetical protein
MNEGRPGMPLGTGTQPARITPSSAGISIRPNTTTVQPPTQHAPPPTRVPIAEEPLELVAEEEPQVNTPQTAGAGVQPPKSKIHGISSSASLAQHNYKRPTHNNKTGAVRMRTFHCRLSEQGVEYLDQIVNDWLEHHPDVEVKHVNSTIGMWDGKLKEPTLILNVWF